MARSPEQAGEFERTEMFSSDPISLHELMHQQGVVQPQSLDELADPDWTDSEEEQRYLEVMLGWKSDLA